MPTRYALPAGRVFSPLDEELGLLPGALSPSIIEGAVRLGTWLPFARAAEFLGLFTRATVSALTVRRLTEGAGAAYEAVQTADAERLEHECPAPPVGPDVQQLSVDGAMVPLRGKGEWAEVKTLTVGTLAAVAPAGGEAHATELSYFSRLAEHTSFSRLATVETHRRGTETASVVCGVVDGADWCQSFLDVHRPDAVRILDFCHAAGHLATLAQAAFGEGTVEAATWYEQQRHALRHDESPDAPDTVLAAAATIRDALAARGASAAVLNVATTAVAYLEKRRDQLRYALFARLGYPLGSGIAESANKLVVEARLKGAGMHWARANVNPLLALRGVACSDRWDDAWPQLVHQLRHHHRAAAATRRATRRARPCVTLQTAPAPPLPVLSPPPAVTSPPRPPRAPLSYGPGRPAPNHPWKHARFLLPSRRSHATTGDAKL